MRRSSVSLKVRFRGRLEHATYTRLALEATAEIFPRSERGSDGWLRFTVVTNEKELSVSGEGKAEPTGSGAAEEPLRGDRDAVEAERMLREMERRASEVPRDFYSVSNPGILFGFQQIARGFVRALSDSGRFPLTDQRILDVGCGWGNWLLELEIWGASQSHLAGLDLEPHRAAVAARRLPEADIQAGNATALPWSNASFDVVLLGTVFSSVLDSDAKRRIAAEVTRVLTPGGMVLWYDFFRNNPRNHHVRGVKADEISSLFPDLEISLRRVTLAPPIARKLARWSWSGCLLLESTKALNTHYLGVFTNRSRPAADRPTSPAGDTQPRE